MSMSTAHHTHASDSAVSLSDTHTPTPVNTGSQANTSQNTAARKYSTKGINRKTLRGTETHIYIRQTDRQRRKDKQILYVCIHRDTQRKNIDRETDRNRDKTDKVTDRLKDSLAGGQINKIRKTDGQHIDRNMSRETHVDRQL